MTFFGVITDHKINTPGNGNNVVYDINATDINDLKEQMKFFGYLKTNDISNIGINPCASKSCSINFAEQCLHILNHKSQLNWLKGRNKIKSVNINQNINPVFTAFK